ncbi:MULTISPECIES: transcription termination factor NusA [unclassified Fusibacter]|uniref:transcription termination factor NusA n=1 Tax=unclassified Fusibacter TaxID=2624464 RepID=UPI0010139D34|nr:transcription termination factor NusA [Fusibacter sp. A1]MCK8058800.1 transcription termination factor NusA [Fusibacter sp. A2]NPE21874.1 transcription termination/antitermination protein NusA [Fusibacter sp. A1]RXV61446.1 transcription termination/antitermination protein NusA [Fusibacter sp. A1]
MKGELIEALEQIEKEKGISKDTLIETIEAALITAYKKNFPDSLNAKILIDRDTGDVKVYSRMVVVEEYYEDYDEILLEDAKLKDPNYEIGDIIEEEVTPRDFGRIAAQTAKQVVVQRIREAERNVIFDEFSSRESEIVTGLVQRQNKGIAYINLGKTEAVLIPSEQIPGEVYAPNERVKTYIVEVKRTSKGPQVVVSRTHPGLVKRLFELEVPEIHDGVVEIKSIAREAGSRTKLAVYANDENIDAVGACVGQRGARVQTIVDELKGEKIDIINWSEDPKVFISNALSPSEVISVHENADERSALVIVPDHQLSLAIGKEGQNARLAAKLTGWKIDIKSQTQYQALLDAQAEKSEA